MADGKRTMTGKDISRLHGLALEPLAAISDDELADEDISPSLRDPAGRRQGALMNNTWQDEAGTFKVGESGMRLSKEEQREETVFGINPEDLEIEATVIGRGACSVVNIATHLGTGELYAVKVFSLLDREKRRQLDREIRTLLHSLRHSCPALVHFYGAFKRPDGMIRVVLEYMDRGSLQDLVDVLQRRHHDDPPPFCPTHTPPMTSDEDSRGGESSSGGSGSSGGGGGGGGGGNDRGGGGGIDRGGGGSANSLLSDLDAASATSQDCEACAALRVGRLGLPEDVVAAVAYQILEGLAYLHGSKRLHRDIKPSNILLNAAGEVKLTDFGIARELDHQGAMVDTVVGTVRYMSPERLMGDAYGWPADIWGLGLVLVECATGVAPYEDGCSQIEILQTLKEHGGEALLPPPAARSLLTQPFLNLVADCLHVEPERRLPADALLGSPWFVLHGMGNREDAVAVVREYLEVIGEGSGGGN